MKSQYEVVEPFTVETKRGDLLNLEKGTIVLLSEEKAGRFAGKLRPIDLRDYGRLYIEAAKQINTDHYPAAYGFIAWTRINHPDLYNQIKDIESQMQTPHEQGIHFEQFQQLVNSWAALHEQAICKYKKVQK